MSIIRTEGIEVSETVPASDQGVALDLRHIAFNDLEIVGGLPLSLSLVGINDIVIYNDGVDVKDYVVGIETVYKLDSGKLSPPVVHGRKTQHMTPINVKSSERIIAAFVGLEDGDPTKRIRALRFTKTNLKKGVVETKGYPAIPPPGYTYSAAFGEIVAFQGVKTRGEEGRLVTIGVQTRFLGYV